MGLSLWLVPNPAQLQLIQKVLPKQPETRPVSAASYPEITPHITLASSRKATQDALLRAIPSTLHPIPVEFQKLEVGDHYFRSVFISVKKTTELVALHEHIMAALDRDGASPSAPAFLHVSISYIADEDGVAERKKAADELRATTVVEGPETGLDDAESVVLRCGDSEGGRVCLTGFEGTEVWIVRCEGPVQHWQVLHKTTATPGVAQD
ncbi:2',3'-cyclic-nucleotide 3'-phosphodiesterase [Suillus subalutaceus]|uniref:2',3'-cyclic-nucleotide 3'-phosphodiesterase n=1 Tax=Suillus subalutaceus TaxID=48586 RepID=UPI001B8852C2|nr:2',3'-cyclic-nucleotide 3'-phosphodiesterase [Suillus subalutaceus]KAG1877714.1 2',3'-cyclic-nucleotide 3'-phosphodiesterase [Suillus subalutaceus]